MSSRPAPWSVDTYITCMPEEVSPMLEATRATVHKAAAQAKERISYRIPAFFQGGTLV